MMFALLLLTLTLDSSEGQEMLVIKGGVAVSLPCGGVAQTDCSDTNWTFSIRSSIVFRGFGNAVRDWTAPVVLVQSGAVSPGPNADRFNLTEACELQIQPVFAEDAGVYTCTQSNQSQPIVQSEVFLSVVSFSALSLSWMTAATCAVHAYGQHCGYSVRWLVQDSEHYYSRTTECSAEIRALVDSPEHDLFSTVVCEVTDLNHNQVYVFRHFGIKDKEPQWNQTLDQNSTEPGNETSEEPYESCAPVFLTQLMLVMRFVELALLSVVLVLLLRAFAGQAFCSSSDRQQKELKTRTRETLEESVV